jgi:hypothetical protein
MDWHSQTLLTLYAGFDYWEDPLERQRKAWVLFRFSLGVEAAAPISPVVLALAHQAHHGYNFCQGLQYQLLPLFVSLT